MRGTARRVLKIVKQVWIKAKASEDEEKVKIFLEVRSFLSVPAAYPFNHRSSQA